MTASLRSSAPAIDPEEGVASPSLPAVVQRFDIHQRLQHALMATTFTVLVLTGWPLSAAGIGASQGLAEFFGGIEGCGVIHRVAAVGLMAAALYHLVYLAALAIRGKRGLPLSMLPSLKDLKDVVGNLAYFFGRSKDRPRFPRYAYFEKFDYWAVFWGMVIMAGSGLVRWFPEASMTLFPTWIYEISHYAHADEGLLAALAIFVWHFYNVHLRPGVFPMSRVFITGQLTIEALEEEHGAEYDALVAKLRAEQPERRS